MPIYSGFTHWKWWFSIAMLVYQRVSKWLQMYTGHSRPTSEIYYPKSTCASEPRTPAQVPFGHGIWAARQGQPCNEWCRCFKKSRNVRNSFQIHPSHNWCWFGVIKFVIDVTKWHRWNMGENRLNEWGPCHRTNKWTQQCHVAYRQSCHEIFGWFRIHFGVVKPS